MKKVIGIFYDASFSEPQFETGCGGSETWVIQISKEFVKRNYHVIVFCNCKEWYFYPSGVEYVDISYFRTRIEHQYFNAFIFVRSLDDYYRFFIKYNDCRNIYLQSHDMFIWKDGIYNKQFIYDEETANEFKYVKKYIALTEFHKWELMHYNNIPEDKIEIIGNGLDSDIFNKINNESYKRDHSILWATAFGRGGDILVNGIMPLVLKILPDFEVHICGYDDRVPDDIKNNPHVKFLGTLTKEEYYREFKKHCCWFLPCVVVEDFGICAAEAAMCECDIISPFKHGMKDVCWAFESLKMKSEFKIIEPFGYHFSSYQLNMSQEEYNEACEEAASKIVTSIMNYGDPYRKKIRQICKDFIMKEHTWKKVVDKWEILFNKS